MMCDSALVINKQDAQKISGFYENRTIKEIMEIYKSNCDIVRNNLTEENLNFESKHNYYKFYLFIYIITYLITYLILAEFSISEDESIRLNKLNEKNMNTSYKIVNDRIVKLKKFEFFFYNVTVINFIMKY